jgi:uncharacterized protein
MTVTSVAADAVPALDARLDAPDWRAASGALDARGWAVVDDVLTAAECAELASFYADEARFRSHVIMARHGFGRGEYKYFAYPLPPIVHALRRALYPRLAPLANAWNERLGSAVRYPSELEAFLSRCHAAGQTRPTPLLLRYGPDDYNCLHQDVYGEHVFPFQVVCLLADPQHDFTGGELVLTEQRPRMQSRVDVVPLTFGGAAIFAVSHRPVDGSRGPYRVNLRHGVSRIRSGRRHTLGVIFHDAK